MTYDHPKAAGNGSNPPVPEELVPVVEALVFAADEPVEPARIGRVFSEVSGRARPDGEQVDVAVDEVNRRYRSAGSALRIERWGGGYRMATSSDYAPYVTNLVSGSGKKGLSRSLMETVAIIAYRQPVTRPEVDFIRGVSADYAIRRLLEYGLIDVVGRDDSLGRPLLYGTTGRFLEQFGLASLDDLPTLREVEELLDDPNFNKERAELLTLKEEADLEHRRLDQLDVKAAQNGEPSPSNGEAAA